MEQVELPTSSTVVGRLIGTLVGTFFNAVVYGFGAAVGACWALRILGVL